MPGTLTLSTLSDGTNSTNATDVVFGSARAWVNFNGTGTVAIRASYNVSSITDNGVGDYLVNFTNALQDANYSSLRNVQETATVQVVRGANASASQANVYVVNTSNVQSDATFVYFAAFR